VSGCEVFRRVLGAAVDGELEGEEGAALEAHSASCIACRRLLEEERVLARELRRLLPRPEAPLDLRERMTALLAETPGAPRAARAHVYWAGAAAAVVLLAVAVQLARGPARSGPPSALATAAADAHLRFLSGQLPLEVGSSSGEEVTRWFQGRVPFHLTLPDYPIGPGERKFYRMLGGRLVNVGGDYGAFVAYRLDDERPISLLVTSTGTQRPSGGEVTSFGNLIFHQQSVNGLKVITWSDNGLSYALASDLTVQGARSCMVCHGSPEERRRIEGFTEPTPPGPI
jgi:anti-sigma factor RsiW